MLSLHIFSIFIVNPFVSLIWKISAHRRNLAFYLHLLVYFITLHIIWCWNECYSLGVSYFIYIIWASIVYFQIIVAETCHVSWTFTTSFTIFFNNCLSNRILIQMMGGFCLLPSCVSLCEARSDFFSQLPFFFECPLLSSFLAWQLP